MTLTRNQENAKTLAALLGIEEADAAQRLGLRIAVTFDASLGPARALAEHVIALLGRTVARAGPPDHEPCAVEVVLGDRLPLTSAARIVSAAQVDGEFRIHIGPPSGTGGDIPALPRPLLIIAACHLAAAAVAAALGSELPIQCSNPIIIPWTKLFGPDLDCLEAPVNIGEVYLAGAGAVGNGFLYALQEADLVGTLYVVDPKKIGAGALNRCLLLQEADINEPKATRLCQRVQPALPKLRLIPKDVTLGQARGERGADFLIDRLVVAVDSRGARRSLQTELPGAVFDASTTDIREVVLHFNRQPTELACLSCIYPVNERERKHDENVAAALGITVTDVRAGFIGHATAAAICQRFPDLRPSDLHGRAFDTLYKELCGVGKLKADGGEQVLAPFAFVSVLAGAHLAVEFLLRIIDQNAANRFNYWRVSPWHSPVPALRQVRGREPHCDFCGRPIVRATIERFWGQAPVAADL
ncbi:MAG: ThiF family adenylyltransferase [Gammaproteobacteria bacterium]|nr:ThiF family adenylyltransferase [Gammaproteobacteria bacterium]